MTSNDSSAIAFALRDAITTTSEPEPIDPVGVLEESAEGLLFRAAAIAPPAGLVQRALDRMAMEPDLTEREDHELLAMWEGTVRAQIVEFSNRPESWDDPASTEFLERCSVVFGVDEDRMPVLVQRFHGLSEGARYGIFLLIERSTLFSFLTREIDADEESRPVENPGESMKSLMRQVFGER